MSRYMGLEALISRLGDAGGSDLYLKVGSPPAMRVHGEIRRLRMPAMTAADTEAMAREVLPFRKWDVLSEEGDAEAGVSFDGIGRFRINVYRQRGVTGLVLRRVATAVPDIEELGLPEIVRQLANETRGLILVTGPSGTGKTTTIASMIRHINQTRRWHIVTLEDPIEVMHDDGRCLIDQREIGTDIGSYAAGLKYAVRQDPDVIFIGEIRDEQTAEAAMRAAETGHLVISTLHTLDATETVNRMIDLFSTARQQQARRAFAGVLKGVISQRLVRRADGKSRVPAVEVLVANGRVAELIVEPGRTNALDDLIREGDAWGMQTFDQSLLSLVRAGVVNVDDAELVATNRHDFVLALTSGNQSNSAFSVAAR